MIPDDSKPVSIKLKELKKPLEAEAFRKERSLHWVIRNALKLHIQQMDMELSVMENMAKRRKV